MKKLILAIAVLILVIGVFVARNNHKTNIKATLSDSTSNVTPSTEIPGQARDDTLKQEKTFLFVPYWGQTAETIPDQYGNELVYFGIAPGKDGIDKTESGYLGLARFKAISTSRETFLTLRMTDSNSSLKILKDKDLEKKIIYQSIDAAKQYGFSGIVLDLEVSSLPFNTITEQMDEFVSDFSSSSKKQNLSFSMMFFGDTFYRFRSYDIIALKPYLYYAFVMAYDLHKANGDPGPNFPLSGNEIYGYDYGEMAADFLNVLPKEKLIIVFGMFGYDWKVDQDGKPIGQATATPLINAKSKFLNECQLRNCEVKRDEKSAETHVSYIDKQGENHIVWFEDEDSVASKEKFLKEKGITNVGFWAYSYY